jgi:hypothetical protein
MGPSGVPRDIVEGVIERSGGVPLFVEKVMRLLLERGERGSAQAIRPTLQQSLVARLDRLGTASETAQIGAALGRGCAQSSATVRRRGTADSRLPFRVLTHNGTHATRIRRPC